MLTLVWINSYKQNKHGYVGYLWKYISFVITIFECWYCGYMSYCVTVASHIVPNFLDHMGNFAYQYSARLNMLKRRYVSRCSLLMFKWNVYFWNQNAGFCRNYITRYSALIVVYIFCENNNLVPRTSLRMHLARTNKTVVQFHFHLQLCFVCFFSAIKFHGLLFFN